MNISTSNNSVSNITFNGNSTASPSIRFQGTQSSNNPVAWEIKYFWIVAIPLIFATIVLPLIASPCARWMMKVMDRSHDIFMIAFSILGQLPYHRQWGCVALVVYVGIVYIGFAVTGLRFLQPMFGSSVLTLWSMRRAWPAYRRKAHLFLWVGVLWIWSLGLMCSVKTVWGPYLGLPFWGIIFARYSRPLWPIVWKWWSGTRFSGLTIRGWIFGFGS